MRIERSTAHRMWTAEGEPVYVVELWTSGGDVERWRLLDAEDVEDVIEWARSRQRGRLLAVSLEHQDEFGTSIVRILGPARSARAAIRSA